MALNKIPLNIAGLNILVSTPEDEEYVQQIGQEIDESVNAILDRNTGASVTSAILLCAIEYLDNAKKATRSANNMRNQIKDYMAEAANAKLQFDEERKKTAELSVEIQTLRNHLTRIAAEGDSSGLLKQMRDEGEEAGAELTRLRKQNEDLTTQNRALAEKSDAMNSYISGQDREIARLTAVSEELGGRLGDKTDVMAGMAERLSAYEIDITGLVRETERLRTELETLEGMIGEERQQQASLFEETSSAPRAIKAEPETDHLPPFETAQPPSEDLAYSRIEDLPKSDSEQAAQPPSAEDRMAAFDIDLSDLPNFIEGGDADEESSDVFGEFTIDADDTILGFNSVPRDRQVEDTEYMRMKLGVDLPKQEEAPDLEPDTATLERIRAVERALEETADVPEDNRDEPAAAPAPKPEKKSKARSGRLEEIVETLEDEDDAMPNLSWTLDI